MSDYKIGQVIFVVDTYGQKIRLPVGAGQLKGKIYAEVTDSVRSNKLKRTFYMED